MLHEFLSYFKSDKKSIRSTSLKEQIELKVDVIHRILKEGQGVDFGVITRSEAENILALMLADCKIEDEAVRAYGELLDCMEDAIYKRIKEEYNPTQYE